MNSKQLDQVQMVDSILSVYATASDNAKVEGIIWYEQANALATILASEFAVPVLDVIKFLAAASPNTSWTIQVKNSREALRRYYYGDEAGALDVFFSLYRGNRAKALKCLAGDYTGVRGPKVNAFSHNIAGDYTVVTVDTWAVKVAGLNAAEFKSGIRAKQYYQIEAAYIQAARQVNLLPAQLQAITWVAFRGKAG